MAGQGDPSLLLTEQVHYCGVCGVGIEQGTPLETLEEHLGKHGKQLAAMNQWAELLKVQSWRGEDATEEAWEDVCEEMQGARDGRDEIERKMEAVGWLSRLLGVEKIIPHGSLLTGVSNGKSDWVDLSLNMTKKIYTLKNLRIRDIEAVKKKRSELEHKYKVVVIPGKEKTQEEKATVTVMSQADDRGDCVTQCIETIKKILSRKHITLLTREGPPDEKTVLLMVEARLSRIIHPAATDLNLNAGTPILRIRGENKPCKENTLLVPIPGKSIELLDATGIPHSDFNHGDISFPTMEATLNALDLLETHHLPVKLYYPKCLAQNWSISARPDTGPRSARVIQKILKTSGESATVACCLVKKWGKLHGVASPRQGFISGFSLSVMFCFYLQQIGLAPYIDKDTVQTHVAADIYTVPGDTWCPVEVKKIFAGFFRYFSRFDWQGRVVTLAVPPRVVVSPADMGFTQEHTLGTMAKQVKDQVHNHLVVGEVYDPSHTGRRITVYRQFYVKGVMCLTVMLLGRGEEGLKVLFQTALGPETEVPWRAVGLRAPSSPCVDNKIIFTPAIKPSVEREMPNPTGTGSPIAAVRAAKPPRPTTYFPPPPPAVRVRYHPRPYPLLSQHHTQFNHQHQYCVPLAVTVSPPSSSYTASSSDSDRNGGY